jgi:zinc protease
MDEGPREQGHLHLLEHLIFHGSEEYPERRAPVYARSSRHETHHGLNAVTSYDETVYRLHLSKADHNASRRR